MEIHNGKWTVYVHINKINGKKYVGITSVKPKYRWGKGSGYKNQPKFYNAIQKYGWNNFEHIIVASNLTQEEANNFEILLIEKLNSINFGYNVSNGGKGLSGFHLTQEQKNKISETHSGKNHMKSKKVFFKGMIFDCIKQCSDYMGVNYRTVKSWLHKDCLPPKNIVDLGLGILGEELLTEYYIPKRKDYTVICEEMEFPTITKCAEYYGYSKTYVKDMLYGNCKISKFFENKNLRFKYDN